jgi:hypothetical protein
MPLDEGNFAILKFNSGNASGVHTASVIKEWNLAGFWKSWSVRMARNGDL